VATTQSQSALPVWIVPGECSIVESALGYQNVLPRIPVIGGPPELRTRISRKLLILPAVLDIPSDLVWIIGAHLRGGATVIIESGAAFAGQLDFRRHRRVLHDGLQLDICAPVELWCQASEPRRTPYVDYTWPHATKIRDFSRVIPIGDQPGQTIAWADGLAVGLTRRVGAGTLIYLGSPLGPALWVGDAEARRWLLRVALPCLARTAPSLS
jgi:hypothetical protein